MKRIFWILLTPAVILSVLLILFNSLVWPPVAEWIRKEAVQIAKKEAGVELDFSDLTYQWFKPALVVRGLEVKTTTETIKEIKDVLHEIRVNEVKIQIDPFQILVGKLMISALTITHLDAEVQVDPWLQSERKTPEDLPLEKLFRQLNKLPLQRIFLEDTHLQFRSRVQDFVVELNRLQTSVLFQFQKILLRGEIPEGLVQWQKGPSLPLKLKTRLMLNPKELKIQDLALNFNRTEASIQGELNNIAKIQTHPEADIRFQTQVSLADIKSMISPFLKGKKFPDLGGEFNSQGQFRMNSLDKWTGAFEINTREVRVDQFEIGNAQFRGEFQNKGALLKQVEIVHPSGKLTLENAELQFSEGFPFKANVDLHSLDLQKLLQSINLHDVPVLLQLNGKVSCQGGLSPFVTDCEGQANADHLHVNTKGNFSGKTIVRIDDMSARGKVRIDSKEVSFKTEVRVGQNQGLSDGTVRFDQGFKVNFKTPEISFGSVRELGGLKFEGVTSIDGSTEGDSHAATFQMNLKAQNFVFENYQLGNLGTELSYEKGHLYLKNIDGLMKQSTYQGSLDIDFSDNDILGQLELPRTDLGDIAEIFDRIYQFPLEVQGTGQARLRFEGPLDFWKLSYKIESQFRNGKIATETFNDLIFNVSALDGNIKTDQVELSKNSSRFSLTGGISSQKKMKLQGIGSGWRLEESERINTLNNSLFGLFNLKGDLSGLITEPELNCEGQITEAVIDEQEIPNSDFKMKINRKNLDLKAQLFGNKISGEIVWPFENQSSPLKINIKTNDWNFTQMLSVLDSSFRQNEYQSLLSSEIDLSSETGDFSKSTGKIHVVNLFLKRGTHFLQNEGPLDIVADDGRLSLHNFVLRGEDNSIQLVGENFTLDRMSVQLKSNLELRLAQMFLPFLEDLGGSSKVTASFTGPITRPEILGSANLDEVFVKFKGFPHALEHVSAEVLFSHSKVLVQNLNGQLAGGNFTGNGEVQIQGLKDFPTNLRFHAENMNLNVPDKIHSSGSADLVFSGRWFPFLISGTYNVSSALVEKEFNDDSGALGSTRQSSYLPKSLKESSFEPIILDLQVVLEKNALIKNTQMDGAVTGQIQVKGPPTSPGLLGKISLEKNSKLMFKDKVFELQSGNVVFNNANEINPDLYLSAQSRVNEYDINLLVQGPSKNPLIRLTSLPPLPEPEIISLLALGMTSSKLEQNVQSKEQAAQTGYEIGAAVISNNPLTKSLQNKLGVNIQISNSYDTTKNISVPKAVISGKLSKRVGYSFSRTLRDTTTNEIKLQYSINQNLSTNISMENKEEQINQVDKESKSILGLDLEYKREFK